jgi:hypothetical protein
MAVGFRSVDGRWLLPALPWGTGAGRNRSLLVDVRRGPDPLAPGLAPWDGLGLAGRDTAPDEGTGAFARRTGAPAGSVVLVFDSGQIHWFTGTCMLGRSPAARDGGAVLALPDLTRKLSASHLEVSDANAAGGAGLWVEDQASSTGTWLDRGPQGRRLAPHEKTPVSAGDVISLGDYRFHIERGGA